MYSFFECFSNFLQENKLFSKSFRIFAAIIRKDYKTSDYGV